MSTQNPSPENQPTPEPKGDAVGLVSDDLFGAFGREVFAEVAERVATESMGEEDERIMEIAAKHGLAKRVNYDPALHGEVDAEPGADIWWWGKPNTADETRPSKKGRAPSVEPTHEPQGQQRALFSGRLVRTFSR